MDYPAGFICYHHIKSKIIKPWPTLTLFMEFWDIWWIPSVKDEQYHRLAHCDQCKNWIQTSSHCRAGIPFTQWPVFSDDVAVFTCTSRSRGWFCDVKARRWGAVFRSHVFDACHPDWQPRPRTGCGAPDDPNCKALDDLEVVRINTHEWETTGSDT